MATFPVGADGKYENPRLTADHLREVYARNPSPEARALLWEIAASGYWFCARTSSRNRWAGAVRNPPT